MVIMTSVFHKHTRLKKVSLRYCLILQVTFSYSSHPCLCATKSNHVSSTSYAFVPFLSKGKLYCTPTHVTRTMLLEEHGCLVFCNILSFLLNNLSPSRVTQTRTTTSNLKLTGKKAPRTLRQQQQQQQQGLVCLESSSQFWRLSIHISTSDLKIILSSRQIIFNFYFDEYWSWKCPLLRPKKHISEKEILKNMILHLLSSSHSTMNPTFQPSFIFYLS